MRKPLIWTVSTVRPAVRNFRQSRTSHRAHSLEDRLGGRERDQTEDSREGQMEGQRRAGASSRKRQTSQRNHTGLVGPDNSQGHDDSKLQTHDNKPQANNKRVGHDSNQPGLRGHTRHSNSKLAVHNSNLRKRRRHDNSSRANHSSGRPAHGTLRIHSRHTERRQRESI